MEIKHCVIPAAGLGTRFLPATKVLPKEMIPVVDRPVIQWSVEEVSSAGIQQVVMVLSHDKALIANHFAPTPQLEEFLQVRGRIEDLQKVRRPSELAEFFYQYQDEPLGLGHSVLCAQSIVGNNPFACLLPDDMSWGEPSVLTELLTAYNKIHQPILALKRMPRQEISRYGVASIAKSEGRMHQLSAVVEKPAVDKAPSDLAIMGRYIFPPEIFHFLAETKPGVGGEIQLTDAIAALIKQTPVWGLEFSAELLDAGTPQGWLATNNKIAQAQHKSGKMFAS